MKNKKRFALGSSVFVACLLAGSLVASASSYSSSLDISSNSTVTGAKRSFSAGTHNIKMTPTSYKEGGNHTSVSTSVRTGGSWSHTTHASGIVNLTGYYTNNKNLGYVKSGKYFYHFSTSDREGLTADPVVMSSR
ncbi:hypothetical protein COC60_24730 [Bacillus thuringiensis]|uniref:Group-specific protein n=5 Tax=Bacillaceae TaxID=186817 RepID=A0A9W7Q3Q4_BACCE|nr:MULTISPECIES: hypothetical protein [Bacillus]EAO55717.1 hypothetical protein RBTH_05612 [Bacillus thuringiensis serovar israelensis ATCC 35646]MED1157448.1 hypothetical protein [Bacillus paranthracis]RCX36923.1 hypothetical protein DEU45_11632 [Bacillus sp. AG102]AFQ24748.1 hypothetical protein BTF1_02625 [Bacillus thuringiensis HD-789]AJH04262.1 hypothetical protein AS86_2947 [Bacillus thuringiensis HD1002]